MKRTFTPFLLALVLATVSGCATIVSKTSYPVVVATNPPGAMVTIENHAGKEVFRGSSPAAVRLKSGGGFFKGATYVVRISKEGYADKMVQVSSTLNGWYFGNLVFGGLVGMLIVDPATGAMFKLENTAISEVLQEKTAFQQVPTLNIYTLEAMPAAWRGHLVKIN